MALDPVVIDLLTRNEVFSPRVDACVLAQLLENGEVEVRRLGDKCFLPTLRPAPTWVDLKSSSSPSSVAATPEDGADISALVLGSRWTAADASGVIVCFSTSSEKHTDARGAVSLFAAVPKSALLLLRTQK